MNKQNKHNKGWSGLEEMKLLDLILEGHDYVTISAMMGRTEHAIISKAQKKGYHKHSDTFRPNKFRVHIEPYGYQGMIWRRHPKHKNYYVSDTGLVWSAIHGKELKRYRLAHKNNVKKGLWVSITRNGKTGHQTKVSRLVAEAFLNLKADQVVVHKNLDKEDNDLANLLIMDKKTAGRATGHMSKSKMVARYSPSGKRVAIYRSARACARELGVSYQTILDYAHNKVKKPKYDIRFYTPPVRKREDYDDDY